eukprot:TRINITY_DN1546_c0_g1_i1.p1 TRINITY_DN1546_c0_g1~~TRINITY_DN1546_c0_g1_i1.p1  ORF type:complete len:976 (-),score=258.51 TRINITY_DN1546_c0_g1_i1:28-2796(-)
MDADKVKKKNEEDQSPDEDEDDADELDDEEEDDEEEDDEPKLRYQRLGANVIEILRKDAASCMAVHEKFLALGTHWGVIHVLDFNGDEIKRFPSHSATINELSIDEYGEYIASCSDDGKVCVNALYSSESFEYEHNRPVISVALDPLYSKKPSKSFAFGGKAGQLIINSKGWFGRKDTVLHSGEGPIHTIKWKGALIAWSNDLGVKIYDCDKGQRITYIDRPKGSPRADLFRCHLCWENEHTLLIGWADSIKIGLIKERGTSSSGLPDRYVEIGALFKTDYYISGIAPFADYLVVLAYVEEQEDDEEGTRQPGEPPKMVAQRPELRIITRKNEDISSDSLTIHGYENYKANHYRLGHMASESLFYVVSPKDIIVAKPRDLDDHISWLMERKRYEEAMRAAEASDAPLREHNYVDIGEKYINYLLGAGQVNKAAEMCPKILKRDPGLWEKWILKFAEMANLKAICDYIPIANPTLNNTVYELVLGYFMSSPDMRDHEKFHNLILEWPPTLYEIKNIITALKRSLLNNDSVILKEALAKLYTYDKQFDKTLAIYLGLGRGPVFELIKDHNLFDSVRDKVIQLMHYDKDKAVQLLVNHIEQIPIESCVEQLQVEPRLLHEYLHQLFLKDPHIGKSFHELQVSLYADYDYKLLLPFLRQSNYYPLSKALQACEEKNLWPEMVFLMGRMGNNKQGLLLLIEKIGDVKQAIDFIETQNDDELWDDLIDYSMKNAHFVSSLLEHIGAYVDPVKLIKRIPSGMEIVGLRDRLVKIISDYNLQMSLREGCMEILKADCVDLAQKLHRGQRRALKVETEIRCAICGGNVLTHRPNTGVIAFFCHHVYHSKCLRGTNAADTGAATPAQQNAAPPNSVDTPTRKNHEVSSEEKKFCQICMNQAKKSRTHHMKGRKLGAAPAAAQTSSASLQDSY